MELEAVLDNNKKVIENLNENLNNNLQKIDNFFETKIGQITNEAIDYGLKKILPDVIENDVIEIKNSIINGGIKEGVEKAVELTFQKGKEILGFSQKTLTSIENIREILKTGNFKEKISNLIDNVVDNVKKGGILTENQADFIKNSKNIILDINKKNIDMELEKQENILEDLDKYCSKWEIALEKGYSFNTLKKHYNNVIKELEEVAPLAETIKKANEIKNQYELLKSKNEVGEELKLSEEEKELCKKFS